jgi:hypothetical protein
LAVLARSAATSLSGQRAKDLAHRESTPSDSATLSENLCHPPSGTPRNSIVPRRNGRGVSDDTIAPAGCAAQAANAVATTVI